MAMMAPMWMNGPWRDDPMDVVEVYLKTYFFTNRYPGTKSKNEADNFGKQCPEGEEIG